MGKKTVDVGLGEAATITPFGLNKTGDFSKEATNRIGIFTSQDIKQNSAKGTE